MYKDNKIKVKEFEYGKIKKNGERKTRKYYYTDKSVLCACEPPKWTNQLSLAPTALLAVMLSVYVENNSEANVKKKLWQNSFYNSLFLWLHE